jgi:hypothetical protein
MAKERPSVAVCMAVTPELLTVNVLSSAVVGAVRVGVAVSARAPLPLGRPGGPLRWVRGVWLKAAATRCLTAPGPP